MASSCAAHCNIFFLGFTLACVLILVYSAAAQPAQPPAFRVLVPDKPPFKEFAQCSNDTSPVKGFCIDVFKRALDILIPTPDWRNSVDFTCYEIGNLTYDTMVNLLAPDVNNGYEAVVGDITISASRMKNASFTQSYLDSGIVVVTRAKDVSQKFPGVFFVPFSTQTWLVAILSLVITGLALWFLECHGNPQFQISESRSEQLKKVFWFVTALVIFFRRETIKNPLAKFVLTAWIIFIGVLGASYTASLSSILTINELSSVSYTIDDLYKMNLTVGYQVGSFVSRYLTDQHNITNLVELSNANEYAAALTNKTVAAVVDEIPYISLFLSAQSASNCKFAVGPKLTIGGLGFAFKNKNLAAAFSVAIRNLSENGEMQRLEDAWKVSNFQCPSSLQSIRLDLGNSYGLFVFLGSAVIIGLVIWVLKDIVIPCWNRMPATPRGDAIDYIREPSFQVPIRRWLSNRYNIMLQREDFA